MKKCHISRAVAALTLAFVVALTSAAPAQAASYKKTINKELGYLTSFEFTELLGNSDSHSVKLSKKTIGVAAAIAVTPTIGEAYDETDDYSLYKIPTKSFKRMAKNLFGKTISTKNLSKKSESAVESYIDAYRTSNGTPVVYICNYDTDMSFVLRSTSFKKVNTSSVKVTRKYYFGYWGNDDGKSYNYTITYTLKKNSGSKFGYVITKMQIKKR